MGPLDATLMSTPDVKPPGSVARVGIIGGTGYTGVELLRLLLPRDDVDVAFVSSRGSAGTRLDAQFPSLRGHTELVFEGPEAVTEAACDIVFFATPNGTAMRQAPALLASGARIIDLSADFRIKDTELWEHWYGEPHLCPELVAEAVYGLPEINREFIAGARIIACPGCYPTAVQLGFLPLLEAGLIKPDSLIADAKSGVSGAGRGAAVPMLLAEASDNFKAYATAGHRHLPEIEQGLERICGAPVNLTFTPHLLPIIRGIHATLYADIKEGVDEVDLQEVFESRYRDERFVDVLPAGSHPETRSVRGANTVRLAVHRPQGRGRVVVLAVEDNLVKGAAGQAVQNMNLLLGLDEAAGLTMPPLSP